MPIVSRKISDEKLCQELRALKDPARAALLMRFFKCGQGEYAEGDRFLGLTVPVVRNACRKYRDLPLPESRALLQSPYHEERFASLVILTHQFERGDGNTRTQIYRLYLANTRRINNWDLVDVSAPNIVGAYLYSGAMPRQKALPVLLPLAKSPLLWNRRIAMLSTLAAIRRGDPQPCYNIARVLLNDKHDLIHKAVGWMLREAGKLCSLAEEERFLRQHAAHMPRTMLRYAIERFPEKKRREFMAIKL